MADQEEWRELGEEEPQGEHRSNQQTPGEYPQEGHHSHQETPAHEGHHSHQETPAQEEGHRSHQETPAHEGHHSHQETPAQEEGYVHEGHHSHQETPAQEEGYVHEGHHSHQETPAQEEGYVHEGHHSHQETPAQEEGHRSHQETPAHEGHHSHQETPAQEEGYVHEGHHSHQETPAQEEGYVHEGHHSHQETPAQEEGYVHEGHHSHQETPAQEEGYVHEGHHSHQETPAQEEGHRSHQETPAHDGQRSLRETPAHEGSQGHRSHQETPAHDGQRSLRETPAHEGSQGHRSNQQTPGEHHQEGHHSHHESPEGHHKRSDSQNEEWREIGEEGNQQQEHGEREPEGVFQSEETQEEGGQPVVHETDGGNGHEADAYPEEQPHGHPEEYPADEQPPEDVHEPEQHQQTEEWRELGEEEAPREHHSRDVDLHQQPQHTDRAAGRDRDTYRKPRQNNQGVARWEPAENEPQEGSDDEFELSTCMAPVYEGEGEEGNEDASVFKNGKPDFQGEIMSCFDEPNVLYRIVERGDKESTWAFYNDSTNYECHVEFTFGKNSKLEALENTTLEQNDKGEFVASTVVYPTETELFVKGKINGFTSKLRAAPLSDDYHHMMSGITQKSIQQEQDAINQVSGGSQNAEEVLAHCLENNIMFVDPEFPPVQSSIDTGAKKPMKPLAWARPQMYLPEEMASQVRLFRSVPVPGQVDAGDLGDSWVMCSVASVSEDPKRLFGMFRHPEGKEAAQREHAVGAYRVTFSKNGWWRTVVVDSYLPVSAGKPKYAKSMNDPAEIWPCILEKAYAKLHGSYAKIITGDPLHALNDMTGFSTLRFDEALVQSSTKKPDEDELFADLIRGIRAGYTVIVNTPGKDPKASTGADADLAEQFKSVGLLTGHAYTILDAKSFPDHNVQIVKIRNAWGHGIEWNGDWGDDDERWTQYPEIAEECNFQKANDGTFWMTWEEVQKYFNGGGICFSHQPAYDYRINSAFNEGVPSCVLEIEVNSPTWFTFVIAQEDKRTKDDADYEYQPVMLSVAQPEEESYKVLFNSTVNGVHPSPDKWTFLQGRDVSLINKLDAGKYLVVPRILNSSNLPQQVPYVLGVITNKEVGTGDVEVAFKTIDGNSRVFENFPKFTAELAQPEEVQFQKRPPGAGFPATLSGERLE